MSFDPQPLTESRIAYIRAIKSEDVARLYPAVPLLAPGQDMFVLHAADGTLIAIADTREAALAGAASSLYETAESHGPGLPTASRAQRPSRPL